jgi:hypothetical protein
MSQDLAGLGLIGGDLRSRAGHRAREVLAGREACWLLLTASVLTGALPGVLTFHQAGRGWARTRQPAADGVSLPGSAPPPPGTVRDGRSAG